MDLTELTELTDTALAAVVMEALYDADEAWGGACASARAYGGLARDHYAEGPGPGHDALHKSAWRLLVARVGQEEADRLIAAAEALGRVYEAAE